MSHGNLFHANREKRSLTKFVIIVDLDRPADPYKLNGVSMFYTQNSGPCKPGSHPNWLGR